MTRPTPATVAVIAAANALGALADSRARLTQPGLLGKDARRVLDGDRATAIARLEELAALGIRGACPWQVTPYGCELLALAVDIACDRPLAGHAATMRTWAKAQPDEASDEEKAPEPWILVAPGMARPYWSGAFSQWVPDLAGASRYDSYYGAMGGADPENTVAVPLSKAEQTAYPNGRPSVPGSDVAAQTAPASAATPPKAAQGATVGERIATEIWDGPTYQRGGGIVHFARRIDAAIREATDTATRIVKDGVESRIQDLTTEAEMLASRIVDVEAEHDATMARTREAEQERDVERSGHLAMIDRSVTILEESKRYMQARDAARAELTEAVRDRDDYVTMLAKAKQELSDLRTNIDALIAGKAR